MYIELLILTREDLIKSSKDKPASEIKIFDFPHEHSNLVYKANKIVFRDDDETVVVLKSRD